MLNKVSENMNLPIPDSSKSRPDISVVLGSLNRRALLQRTIDSVRRNGFPGEIEIIVVDGGSTDGSCDWLAKQRDVFTIIQPNYKVIGDGGTKRRAHSWGKFMNLGFRRASAAWVLMISDDLLLCPGSLQSGLNELAKRLKGGEKIGGGALFWRDYPKDRRYHVKRIHGDFVHINHGFYYKKALKEVGFANETDYEFYGADSDLTIRLNLAGWKTIALRGCYAEHLNHRVSFRKIITKRRPLHTTDDMNIFQRNYCHLSQEVFDMEQAWYDDHRIAKRFWLCDPISCLQGLVRRYIGR